MSKYLYTKYVGGHDDHVMNSKILNPEDIINLNIEINKDLGFGNITKYEYLCGEYNMGFWTSEYLFDISNQSSKENRIFIMALREINLKQIFDEV